MKFLTPLIIFGLAIAIFFWYIDPTYYQIQTAKAEGDQYQAALERAQAAVTKRDTLLSNYNSLSTANIKRIQATIPDSVNPIQLIIDMNAMAAKYGTTLRNMKVADPSAGPAPAADGKVYEPSQMTFTISLSYQNFLNFLGDLERNLRLTDVTSVSFTPNDSGLYDYDFSVNTYWLK